jgi:hypothetical protein
MNKTSLKAGLKYAFRELILLVLGILIALSVNNWNERRKSQRELNTILSVVQSDLSLDIADAKIIRDTYIEQMALLDSVLNDSVHPDRLYQCRSCLSIHLNFSELSVQTKGMNMLQNFHSSENIVEDSLIILLEKFYTGIMVANETLGGLVNRNVEDNLKYYRNTHTWYADFLSGELRNEMFNDILKAPLSRNRIIHHKLLVLGNYVPMLNTFITSGEDLIEQLKERTTN